MVKMKKSGLGLVIPKTLRIGGVRFTRHMVSRQEMTAVDGRLALVSDEFADFTKGWALVRVIGDRCSPQTIQTRCTLYQQYMTDEALQRAAKSYGGITDKLGKY